MLQAFPRSFVRIAWLVRIGNNSQNAFHDEVIRKRLRQNNQHIDQSHHQHF